MTKLQVLRFVQLRITDIQQDLVQYKLTEAQEKAHELKENINAMLRQEGITNG